MFEFLQDFSENVLHSKLASMDLDFQVRILKQRSEDALPELLAADWFEPESVSSKYGFSFSGNGRADKTVVLPEEKIRRYVLGGYVYRHYVVVSDMGDMGPGFANSVALLVSGAADAGIPVRRLSDRDLEAYVFDSLNFPDRRGS